MMTLINAPKRVLYGIVAFVFLGVLLLQGSRLMISESLQLRHENLRSRDLLEDVYNSTLGFEKIFVVNLASRTDRRDGMSLQAGLSNLELEFINGPNGKDISDKAIPKQSAHDRLGDGSLGSWRAHMNAVREIVERNLTSALILEDDTDWDVRIRDQLRDFAKSSRVLIQPLTGPELKFADESLNTNKPEGAKQDDISFNNLPETVEPHVSPYGDDWDVLWIGHCGMHFPFHDNHIPKGRVIHVDDITVPKKDHLWTLNIPFTLKDDYPNHTRAVHRAQEGVCTLGYALSHKGAMKLLHEVALKDVTDNYDILLRFFCEGSKGRARHKCYTTQPALFHHHRPAGAISSQSNIGNHGDGFREKAGTDMVRWSVRLNVEALANGRTNYVDQFPE